MDEVEDDDIGVSIEDMILPILDEKPGSVQLGNVCFKWDGAKLSWNIPVMDWDMNAIGEDLVRRAGENQKVSEMMRECGYSG